jgi:hypothetical protein
VCTQELTLHLAAFRRARRRAAACQVLRMAQLLTAESVNQFDPIYWGRVSACQVPEVGKHSLQLPVRMEQSPFEHFHRNSCQRSPPQYVWSKPPWASRVTLGVRLLVLYQRR